MICTGLSGQKGNESIMNQLLRGESCPNPRFEMTDCAGWALMNELDSRNSSLQDFIEPDEEISGAAGKIAKPFVRHVLQKSALEIRFRFL
jgi:hypothetical protein